MGAPAMAFGFAPVVKSRTLKILLVSGVVLASPGCAYFRWNGPSYQEIHERAQKEKAIDQMMWKPGEVLYSQ